MRQLQAFLMSAAIVIGLTACCCTFGNIGNNPAADGANKDDAGDGDIKKPGGDPAEQAAIQFVKKQNGSVTEVDGHVVEARVQFNKINDDQLKEFAAFSRLRKLDLISNSGITGSGFKALAGLQNLEDLRIPNCGLTDSGMQGLATLTRLKVLVIGQNRNVTDAGWSELGKMPELVSLRIYDNKFTTKTPAVLASNCRKLEMLYIGNSGDGLNDAGLLELCKLPNLKELHIYGTRTTNVGFANLPKVKTLETLHVSFSDVNDASAKIFAQCKSLRNLDIFATRMTDKGLQDLGTLPNLKELRLNANSGITPAGKEAFIKAHPSITVK